MRMPRRATLVLLLCTPLGLSACLTTMTRQDVYEEGRIEVFLRSEKRLARAVEKGFDHPVTISPVRMAHILSRIDLRRSVADGNRREPAINTEILYSLAAGLSQALAKAGPDQEVVAMAVRVAATFTVLKDEHLTSLVAFARGGQLNLYLARSDWLVKSRRRDYKLPQPRLGERPTKIKLYGGVGLTLIDTHSLAIDWRDPIFSRPTRTKILPTGEVKRKTILLESPADVDDEESTGLPRDLSPGQLRALADLEEERLAGGITEAEYRLRRREILDRL